MTLIVETGAGLANADAFVSLAYVDDYFGVDDRNNTAWTGPTGAKEAAIRRASATLSTSYAWKGVRVQGRSQALAWPRLYVVDAEGYTVPSNAVPWEIQAATAELALRELVTPGFLTPDVTSTTNTAVKRRYRKVGELETEDEYFNAVIFTGGQSNVVGGLMDLIGGLLSTAGGSSLAGETMRV